MLPLSTKAPEFNLPDTGGNSVSLSDFKDAPAMLVVFMCNHCPYVKHIREALVELVKEYQAKGVAVVGINSNDVETYPDDSPEDLRNALDALLAGSEVVSEQKPSMGCNIKWKQGNEPEYFKI